MLKQFVESLYLICQQHLPLETQIRQMRDSLKNALSSEEFKCECFDQLLNSVAAQNWKCPPIFYDQSLGIAIRLIFWPAFYSNNPHKHKTWSVTGIFYNQLNVQTFDLVGDFSELHENQHIAATTGDVGFILPECIHNISNPSPDTSISIHIFNNLPGIKSSEENAIWYPSPKKHDLSQKLQSRVLIAMTNCLAGMKHSKTSQLLERIYEWDDEEIRFYALRALKKVNYAKFGQCKEGFLVQPVAV